MNADECEVVAKTTNPVEGVSLINQYNPDVVFLDIEMPDLNGFQLLESLSNINFEVVFVTAYGQYAIEAIKKNAFDYILKPVSIPEVMNALGKVKEKLRNQQVFSTDYYKLIKDLNPNHVQRNKIPTLKGFEFINIDDLIHLEADGSYTSAFLKNNGKILISKPIKEIESLLNPTSFFRSHRSHIVNIAYIQSFSKENYEIAMVDNSKIPLSRRRYDAFNSIL